MTVVLGYKFAAIPEWVLYHPDLSGDDVRVFGVLARYGNDVRPSRQTIAERIGKSTDTVDRCVGRLTAAGAVRVEARYEGDTRLPNRYHLAGDDPIPAEGGRTDAEGGGRKAAAGVAAPVRKEREQDNESKNNESYAPSARVRDPQKHVYDEQFEAWWTRYPRKIDKAKCETRWRRLTEGQRAEAEVGLDKWVTFWSVKGEPDKVPHPYTWLNNSRWEADPPMLSAVPKPTSMMDRVRQRRAAEQATKTGTQT